MARNTTRRGFFMGAAACAALPLRSFCKTSVADRYSVAVLGDTHYDVEPESVYHSHYDESNKWAKVQHEEFRRNGEMWRERCPRLVEASGAVSKSRDTQFVLQMGDIIQGDCDDAPTHVRMLEDAVKSLRSPYPAGMPFLTVIGNHDFRGKGARSAYMEFSEKFMAREILRLTGEECVARYPVYSFRFGPDLWVFCDFETKDLQPIVDSIESGVNARHVFLVTHGPFTTPDGGGSFRWRLGGSRKCDALRPKLYEALSRRHAVVLSGHTHTTAYYRHENRFGGFCEFTANSVWAKPELATGKAIHSSVSDYGAMNLARLADDKLQDFKESLDVFRHGLKDYFFSTAAGHYRLDVSDDAVQMSFCPGDERTPAWTVRL